MKRKNGINKLLGIKKNNKPINRKVKSNTKNFLVIMEKRYKVVIFVIVLLYVIICTRLFYLQVLKNDVYDEKLSYSTEKTIESTSAPRGRIYDRNYNLLVDNEAVKTIYYKKRDGVTAKEEINLAYLIADNIDLDYSKVNDVRLKNFYYKGHYDECRTLINNKEWDLYEKRKLNDSDIIDLIYDRISERINDFDERDKKAAYIYYLMNKGYSYSEKIIKNRNVTDAEYAFVSENIDSLDGFNTKLDWERVYVYGDVFKSILGSVSSNSQGIPQELSEAYLKKGYSLDDRVGISYLEYQYEDYLKGTKAKYRLLSDNSYELVKDGERGNDVVLTIDINLQKALEDILSYEVLRAKEEYGTQYYNRSFAIVSNPYTGEIFAMSGKQVKYDENGQKFVVDYTPGIVTLPVTPGSIVKGASMLVGYKYGAIDIGSRQLDECLKIKNTPLKCSWRTMGSIDDIYALQYSSNVYQYKIAISVGNGTYRYDEGLLLDESAFDKYRDMYASFGLGIKTGIDLPVESLGYMGNSRLPGHLLDFSIGQYDTYTPIQLSQYINTLANGGTRYKPYLLKEVYKGDSKDKFGSLIYKTEPEKLGVVDIDSRYIDRVHEGFSAVVSYGLGYGYMGDYTNSAGKTGTSQSFIDTDDDGKVDTETITSSFVGYSPSVNPEMSIVVVSPDIGLPNSTTSAVTKRISASIVNKYYELK